MNSDYKPISRTVAVAMLESALFLISRYIIIPNADIVTYLNELKYNCVALPSDTHISLLGAKLFVLSNFLKTVPEQYRTDAISTFITHVDDLL